MSLMTKFLQMQSRTVVLPIIVLLLISLICPSFLIVLFLVWAFLAGAALVYFTLSPDVLLPNILSCRISKNKKSPSAQETLQKLCPVCGKNNCNRHRPELSIIALHPWTGLTIPQTVDDALEEFLNLVLKEFVYTWYRDLSADESFVNELRCSLRFLASVLLRRLEKVDLTSLITGNILRSAIGHLHFYLEVRNRGVKGTALETEVLHYYGLSLHCAMYNRRAELNYLKEVANKLFPYVLPALSLKCRSLFVLLREITAGAILLPAMDVVANPDIINKILILLLEDTPSDMYLDPPSRPVTILENFSQPLATNSSCLHFELQDILANQEILFQFMQFLKAEASVNVLQFYLTVEEINCKILTPELSRKQFEDIHQELKALYRTYCDPQAVDKIQFDEEIVREIRQICQGPPEGVVKLQTTTPLFRAYDHVYNLLLNTFLPLFHQSDDYYKMLCGERLPTHVPKILSKSQKRPLGETISLSRLGSRIKGVFKSSTVDDRLPEFTDDDSQENEPLSSVGGDFSSIPQFNGQNLGPLHDLRAWRVTVPEVCAKTSLENSKQQYHVFMIEVRRVDVLEDDFEASNWIVERRYNEFYILEQKLTEFHGELDVQLPPKRAFGLKRKDFLETMRTIFEEYLQKLLTLPFLCGSELLYNFFNSDREFTSGFLVDINLGKMMRSSAMKLVKERGQHLEPFLQSFLMSTETVRAKKSFPPEKDKDKDKDNENVKDKDSDTISISSEKMSNSLYEDNANREDALSMPDYGLSMDSVPKMPVCGPFDTILYLVYQLYNAPSWLINTFLSVRILAKNTIDVYLDWYLSSKLDEVLQEHYVVKVIHLLRDTIFFDPDNPRTTEEKEQTRTEALTVLKQFIPKVFAHAVGPEKYRIGTEILFEALQYPRLNKQLTYVLLDEILEELFPELLTSPKTPS